MSASTFGQMVSPLRDTGVHLVSSSSSANRPPPVYQQQHQPDFSQESLLFSLENNQTFQPPPQQQQQNHHQQQNNQNQNQQQRPRSSSTKNAKEKVHLCKFCNKAFSRSTHLKTHERVHTGEKPFQCKVCDKRFGDPSNLKRHSRVHSGEKPYPCRFCQKTFTTSTHRRTHERLHADRRTTTSSTKSPQPQDNNTLLFQKPQVYDGPGKQHNSSLGNANTSAPQHLIPPTPQKNPPSSLYRQHSLKPRSLIQDLNSCLTQIPNRPPPPYRPRSGAARSAFGADALSSSSSLEPPPPSLPSSHLSQQSMSMTPYLPEGGDFFTSLDDLIADGGAMLLDFSIPCGSSGGDTQHLMAC